jgi:hypothetical protein
MTHEEYRGLLALHALGSAEPAEQHALESHLETCPSCAAELAELRESAAHLALVAAPITPSAEATRRLWRALDAGESVASGTVRAPRRWRPRLLALRTAVAAVIVILGIAQIRLASRLEDAHAQIERMRDLGRFLTSPDVSVVSLWGGDAAPGTHAKLAYEHSSGRFVLVSSRMPPAPAGSRYELWVISERIYPAGLFSPEAPAGTLAFAPRGDTPFLFAVSIESSADADEPSGPLVLVGSLSTPRAPESRRIRTPY